VKFLCELPSNIRSNDIYKFWPIITKDTSGSIGFFCKDILHNVVKNLDIKDCVFKGPSSSNAIGTVPEVPADSYAISSNMSEFHWLSLFNGYLEDTILDHRIIDNIGFPIILSLHPDIKEALENSDHKNSIRSVSPNIIRSYLKSNGNKWENDQIQKKDVLHLFKYILKDRNFDELEGFKMIPLADGNLGTLTSFGSSHVYIINPDNALTRHANDECNIFRDQLNKFVDKSIENYELYYCMYENAKAGWNLNIKILNETAVVDMVILSLNYAGNARDSEEIDVLDHLEWIHQLWGNLEYRNWDLTKFEDIHLIPTNRSTLRKLKTPRKILSNKGCENIQMNSFISIFKKFDAAFVDEDFEIGWDR
jgi:hypothetical protein